MKLHLHRPGSDNMITGYDRESVTVNGERFNHSIVILPDEIIKDWNVAGFGALAKNDFDYLAELGVEVVILGTGARLRFPPPAWMAAFAGKKGLEVMDTGAACRTYNILMSEGRTVAAALLFEEAGA